MEQLSKLKQQDEEDKQLILQLTSEWEGFIAGKKEFNRLYQHYTAIRKVSMLANVEIAELMDYKGYKKFMTDFKIVTGILTSEESIKLFNLINNGKVKEGHINLEMFKNIPVIISVTYPERITELMRKIEGDDEYRSKLEKLR